MYFPIKNISFVVKLNAHCTAAYAKCPRNQKYTAESYPCG